MKTCNVCKIEKPLSQFSKHSQNKDGLRYECKECMAEWVKTNSGKATRLYSSCLRRAKLSGAKVTIDKNWILERLENGICELTSMPFSFEGRGEYTRQPHAPSIDRIDPKNKNYTPDNCRLVLWAVNCSMAEYGEEVMLPIFEKIIENVRKNELTSIPKKHLGESQGDTTSRPIHGTGFGQDCDGAHHHRGEPEGEDSCDSTQEGCRICMGSGVRQMEALELYANSQDYGLTKPETERLAKLFGCVCYQH